MIAEKPELILNVEVRNSSGQLLKYFPVEIRGNRGTISSQWRVDKKLTRRTDENGRCTFTDVPNVAGLKLVLQGNESISNEKLDEEAKKIAGGKQKIFLGGSAC